MLKSEYLRKYAVIIIYSTYNIQSDFFNTKNSICVKILTFNKLFFIKVFKYIEIYIFFILLYYLCLIGTILF